MADWASRFMDSAANAPGYMEQASSAYDTYVKPVVSGVNEYGGAAMDYLNTNKDAIGAIGGLAGTYLDYTANLGMQDLAKQQLGAQQAATARGIAKEDAGSNAIQQGFLQGFLDPRKKKEDTLGLAAPMNSGLAGSGLQ